MARAGCERFGLCAQLIALRAYVQGMLRESGGKSMQARLARVTEPIAHQAFQHFFTNAPWDASRMWRRLRPVIPRRRGVFILHGTSFPNQGLTRGKQRNAPGSGIFI